MAKLIPAKSVDRVIRRYLQGKGCTLSAPKKSGQTGPDIVANLRRKTWFVEVIGFEEHPPIRSREFYEAFFRAISRDRNKPYDVLVLGLPLRFKQGMPRRKQQYPIAWAKLGTAFPNLMVWYVDTKEGGVQELQWSNA